jgi:hypothetical protein
MRHAALQIQTTFGGAFQIPPCYQQDWELFAIAQTHLRQARRSYLEANDHLVLFDDEDGAGMVARLLDAYVVANDVKRWRYLASERDLGMYICTKSAQDGDPRFLEPVCSRIYVWEEPDSDDQPF